MYGSYGRLGAADTVEVGSGVLLDSEGDKPIFSWLKEQASTIDLQNLVEQQQSGDGGFLSSFGFGKKRKEAEAQAAEANRRAQQAELQAAAAAKKSKQYMMAAIGAAGLLAVVLVVKG